MADKIDVKLVLELRDEKMAAKIIVIGMLIDDSPGMEIFKYSLFHSSHR